MKIEQLYTKCLSQGSYYIQSGDEVAIIDPLRETLPYLEKAKANGATIVYIFETHFHADFVSGHLTLAKQTGTPIVYGPLATPRFKAHIAHDGEEFKIGKITLRVLHTPGHTMESTTYLLLDENGKEHALFTGDTLLIGDVGRPDLAQKSSGKTSEELAGLLYESIQTKIVPLSDEVIIYPAHGAGSLCGKAMMKETMDTLGNQKKHNYALRASITKEEFIEEVTHGLLPPPAYFPSNVRLNQEGYQSTEEVTKRGLQPLSPKDVEIFIQEQQALLLDVRKSHDFATAHIPSSIFIGLDGRFAPWVGDLLIDITKPLVLITPAGREHETIVRLARVGFDHILGFLEGGIPSWEKSGRKVTQVVSLSASNFATQYQANAIDIYDVRQEPEYILGHLPKAHNIPLTHIATSWDQFPASTPFYLHCAGGYRSMIAASILLSKGILHPINVEGGFSAIQKTPLLSQPTTP